MLLITKERINRMENWNAQEISATIKEVIRELKQPSKVVMQILRYALAGLESGVGVPVIIEILGKETVIKRLDKCKS